MRIETCFFPGGVEEEWNDHLFKLLLSFYLWNIFGISMEYDGKSMVFMWFSRYNTGILKNLFDEYVQCFINV